MRLLVESLKRLYQSGKLDEEKVMSMVSEGKITEEEMEYIFAKKR